MDIHKFKFFLTRIKMIEISLDTYKQNGIETLFDHRERLWLNEKHIEERMGYSALRVTASTYPSRCRKQRQKLVDCNNYQPCRMFLRGKLVKILIMDSRTAGSCDLK